MDTNNNYGFGRAHTHNGSGPDNSHADNPTIAAALKYHRRGWSVVALDGKRPKARAWQKVKYDESELPGIFASKNCNIGLRLGGSSDGLVDVDLDSAEARDHASTFLPPTPAKFGRKSSPRSHWLFRVDPPSVKTERLADPDYSESKHDDHKGAVVELRGDGAQTMAPPSLHPSSELVCWESEFAPTPAKAGLEALRAAVHKVAAASVLSRRWPKIQRHDAAMALAGALRQGDWNADDTTQFVLAIAQVGGDEEIQDRQRAIEDTNRKFDAQEPVAGIAKCRELFGDKLWMRVSEWLGLRCVSNGFKTVPYEATPSGIVFHKLTPSGEKVTTPLCNFNARIKGDIEHNDGVESSRHFEIELTVDKVTKTATIPAKEFPSFSWLAEKFGSQPSIYAGNGFKDRTRDAVQRLSTGTFERAVRTHTGWTPINGGNVFLHAGGAIGAGSANVEVELPPQLSAFNIPAAIPEKAVAGIRSSLRLLDLAPDHIMIPLLCAVWRAPLGPCDFGLHVYGPTGLLKSELAALAWQHYGAGFNARNLLAWSSTSNFLQGLSFACKDGIAVFDDLLSTNASAVDKLKQHASAEAIFRALGNNAGKGRMRSDTTLRPMKPTRCLVISTGEEVPHGQSLRARFWIVPVTAEDTGRDVMDFKLLTELQRAAAAGVFAHAMRGFIEYLAPQYAAVREGLRDRVSEHRDRAAGEIGNAHARTPTMLADLFVGFETFIAFAVERGAITESEAAELKARAWSALIDGARAQVRVQSEEEPARRYIELLVAAFTAGKAYLARSTPLKGPVEEKWPWGDPDSVKIGWVDGNSVYLNEDAAYLAAQQMAGDGGFLVDKTALRRHLKDQGLLASTDLARQTLVVRKTFEGIEQTKLLHLWTYSFGVTDKTKDSTEAKY